MTTLMILAGLALLVFGGDLLVRGAVGLAARLGVSALAIGLTVVGFGTSTPELVTSIEAALRDAPGVAVGNVVGSNICNILLILGVAAVIRPVTATPRAFRRDGVALVLASLLGLWACLEGHIGRVAGGLLFAALAVYIAAAFLLERQAQPEATDEDETIRIARADSLPLLLLRLVGGLVLTVAGAKLLVEGAIDLARGIGVSETVIGLTVVAVGTSLPELVTSVVAALRGQSDVAFGNVVGSNIYNILGILGITAIVQPLAIPPEIALFDIWIMMGATAALVVTTMSGWKVCRFEGALLLVGYAAYVGWLARQSFAAAGVA